VVTTDFGTAAAGGGMGKEDDRLKRVNVGMEEPLSSLLEEFRYNQGQQQQIRKLMGEEKYSRWRRIRGDGNCYYRAFMFGIIEYLISKSP